MTVGAVGNVGADKFRALAAEPHNLCLLVERSMEDQIRNLQRCKNGRLQTVAAGVACWSTPMEGQIHN